MPPEREGRTLDVVQQHVLEEDDGVVGADGGFQEALRIGHSGASHELYARDGLEVRLQSLRVLGTQLAAHSPWPSDHHGDLRAPPSPALLGQACESTGRPVERDMWR